MHSGGSNLRHHLVDESNVGESTTGHDLIVTSAGTVRVEVLGGNTTLSEVTGSGRVLGNLSGGRDVISSDRVTDVQEAMSVVNASNRGGASLSSCEERRVMDVS